jgi:hypothetical protein
MMVPRWLDVSDGGWVCMIGMRDTGKSDATHVHTHTHTHTHRHMHTHIGGGWWW